MKWFLNMIKTYRGLPKEIYVLFLATIINRFGGFVHPFMALFLSYKMGMDEEQVGFITALAGAAVLFGTLPGGYLGDKIGRKKTYVIAQGIAALLLVPCGFFGTNSAIPILLIMSTFFNASTRPISSAMITDLVKQDQRKNAFSLIYLGINFGVAIGPLVAAVLFDKYLSWLFWGDAITTFIGLGLIIKFVPETKLSDEKIEAMKHEISEKEQAEKGNMLEAFMKRPILVFYTLFSIFSAFVYAQSGFALPLALGELFGETGGTNLFGILMSFNAIVVLSFTLVITKLTDRIKSIYNIAIGNFLYIIGFGMMAFIVDIRLIYISVFIWTLGEIIAATNSGVFVSEHTPITHRSRFNSIINIVKGVGRMLSPAVGGLIIGTYNMNVLWIITAVLALVATIGLVVIGKIDHSKNLKKGMY